MLQAVALDPRFGSRKTREFICGGAAGQLVLNSRVCCSGCDLCCQLLHPADTVTHMERHVMRLGYDKHAPAQSKPGWPHKATYHLSLTAHSEPNSLAAPRDGWVPKTLCCTLERAPFPSFSGQAPWWLGQTTLESRYATLAWQPSKLGLAEVMGAIAQHDSLWCLQDQGSV
jgi:hypothetical protein